MAEIDFLSSIHKKTKRDYIARMTGYPKADANRKAKKYDYDYWDGDRKFGYGGYKYDGRWRTVADSMSKYYALKAGSKLLDVGCGKGILLYDFTQAVPGIDVRGVDISEYAIKNSKEEVRQFLGKADASSRLPFADKSFDLVISINTLHNLYCYDLVKALSEMERLGKNKYLVVESYRNEEEKVNMMCWVLTGECFFTPKEWKWFFDLSGYTGDYSFIYFE